MEKSILEILKRTVFIILFSFIFAYMIPFLIVSNTGAMHLNKDFVKEVTNPAVRELYANDTLQIAKINRQIAHLKAMQIDSLAGCNDNTASQISTLENIRKEIQHKRYFSPFDNNRISYIWPLAITILLFIYFVVLSEKLEFSLLQFLLLFSSMLLFLMLPMWLRNSDLGQENRVIYSVYNKDINIYMYYFQYMLLVLSLVLVVLIWMKCIQQVKYSKNIQSTAIDFDSITLLMKRLKQHYIRWQVLSICLIGVFGAFAYHFWRCVFVENDQRYVIQAVAFNVLWVISWVMASIPLYLDQQNWKTLSERILFRKSDKLKMEENNIDAEQFRKYISEFEIATNNNKAFTFGISVFSMIFPLVRHLLTT